MPVMSVAKEQQRMNRMVIAIVLGFSAVLSGCVVKETRPLAKLEAVQAKTQIPEAELLDVHCDISILVCL